MNQTSEGDRGEAKAGPVLWSGVTHEYGHLVASSSSGSSMMDCDDEPRRPIAIESLRSSSASCRQATEGISNDSVCAHCVWRVAWRLLQTALLGVVTLSGAACVTVDHNTAATLGTAGMQATQVLSGQASGAAQNLGELNKWWGVHDTLVCTNVKSELRQACVDNAIKKVEDPSVKQLIDVLNKRKQAIDTLNQAYASFVDLAHYNAGQEATAALKTTFSDINGFLSAVSAISGGVALPAISSTLEKVTGGVTGLIADNRQNAQILAANKDLASANDALYQGLKAESKVMDSILLTLQQEREALYKSGFDAGLINPTDILTPVFAEAYLGIRLESPPAASRDVVKAAAGSVVSFQNRQTNARIAASYETALSTLHALESQHDKLQNKQSINVGSLQAEVSNLKVDVAQMTSTSAPSSNK